jgi:DNA repair exonuclease SbcCD nuclease subunit
MATADEGEAHESESPNKGRKPKKKVEYAFGTPTHSVNAYSAYAHLRSIDNVDFAKGLSQSGENLFASSERGARSITSTISPPTAAKKKLTTLSSNNMGASIKITEQNACQRKDCREVVKALLAGQIRIDAEKEEIVDELDRLTAEMREMETTLETYESRQKALHIENIQLESLNEKQLEKSRTLEDAKRALQREQDTFSQTVRTSSNTHKIRTIIVPCNIYKAI